MFLSEDLNTYINPIKGVKNKLTMNAFNPPQIRSEPNFITEIIVSKYIIIVININSLLIKEKSAIGLIKYNQQDPYNG